MNFWTILDGQREAFSDVLRDLNRQKEPPNPPTDRFDGLIAAVTELKDMLDALMVNAEGIDPKRIVSTHKHLMQELQRYDKARRRQGAANPDDPSIASLFALSRHYTDHTLKPLLDTVNTLNADIDKVLSTDMDHVKDLGKKNTTFITDEDDTASLSDNNTVGRILWVGENIALAERIGQYNRKFQDTEAHKRYQTLLEKLENDTPINQMRYAKLLANRERQLTKKIVEAYQTYNARYADDPDHDRKVMEALVTDENYRAAKSYFALKDNLMLGSMEMPLRIATQTLVTPDVSNGLDMEIMMSGNMEQQLRADPSPYAAQALQQSSQLDANNFKATNLPKNEFADYLFNLSMHFALDPDHSSSPFYRIAYKINELQKENLEDLSAPSTQKQLRACYFEAQHYLKTHRKKPFTAEGRERVRIAQGVVTMLGKTMYPVKEAEEVAAPDGGDLQLVDINRRLGNVGTAKVKTKMPKVRSSLPLSNIRTDAKVRGNAHKIYSCFVALEQITTGLPTNIVGAGMWLYQKLKGKSDTEKNAKPYDAEHVPFMREDKYREPEGDDIITDKRRIPLVWERRIPEDPNQPNTLTFEVDQPYEGSNVGMGYNPENVGHAFLTLKYTKKNPVTGKLERYKTSFGFYPQFSGVSMALAGATIGSSVPGSIEPDFSHPVSVGSTVNITNKQFNDIIRFTGEYERGGYNMATRNCTDFAMDAVRHAGVRIPELEQVKKVDVTNKGIQGIGIGGADLLVGHLLTNELYKNKIRNRLAEKDTSNYTRIGQSKASKEDMERCYHSDLNTRLRGYAPGATAEAIRGSFSFALHSKKYLGTSDMRKKAFDSLSKYEGATSTELEALELTRKKVGKKASSLDDLTSGPKTSFILELMRMEAPRMRRSLEKVFGTKDAELNQVLDKMDRLHSNICNYIDFGSAAFTNPGKSLDNADTRPGILKDITDASTSLNDYIAALDYIFHDVFRSDPRANIPFQNMVSLAEQLQDQVHKAYDSYSSMTDHFSIKTNEILSASDLCKEQKMETQLYDQTRDASHAICHANHLAVSCKVSDKNGIKKSLMMTPAKCLAIVLSFDDPVDAVRRFRFKPQNPDTKAEEKEAEKTEAMKSMATTTMQALETLQDGHEYTNAELDAVFNRLPKFELEVEMSSSKASPCYQTMALSAILGDNFLGDMNAEFMRMLEPHREQLELPKSLAELGDLYDKVDSGNRIFGQKTQEQINALSGIEKEEYDKYVQLLRDMENIPSADEAHEKLKQMKVFLNDFTAFASERLEARLNRLPQAKKDKLNNIVSIMAKDLIREQHATTEEAKMNCVAQAKENLGRSITQCYLYSICEKAVNQAAAQQKLSENVFGAHDNWERTFRTDVPIPTMFKPPVQAVANRGPSIHQAQNAPVQGGQQRNSVRQAH